MKTKIDKLVEKIKERTNKIKLNFCPADYYKGDINLTDKVVVYTTGEYKWKFIPLDLILRYSIFYDTYIDIETSNKSDCSLIVCPLTLQAVLLIGKFIIQTYYNNRMVLCKEDTKEIASIELGEKISTTNKISPNQRVDVKIMTYKDAIMFIQDIMIAYPTKGKEEEEIILEDYLIKKEYYENDLDFEDNKLEYLIHPKTLTYVIQYKSGKGIDKYTILVGKDSSKDEITGYNLKKSDLLEYLNKYKEKIINRNGYIMPILWYMTKYIYPKAKIILIN
jgi:hypothetical protein